MYVVNTCIFVCVRQWGVFVLHIDNFINAVTFSIKYAQHRQTQLHKSPHTHIFVPRPRRESPPTPHMRHQSLESRLMRYVQCTYVQVCSFLVGYKLQINQ